MATSDHKLIIAIDGGAGTGTSTAAKGAAKALGIPHLNTGELYRSITYAAIKAGVTPDDGAGLHEVTKKLDIKLEEGNVVEVNGEDVRGKLHLQDVNDWVSEVSSHPEVRDEILSLQRDYAKANGVVMEGRDIGTRIFPDATLKFFFVCDPEERVRRLNAGSRAHETVESIKRRDASDSARSKVGALRQADDAIVMDTTHKTVEQVVAEIVQAARNKGY